MTGPIGLRAFGAALAIGALALGVAGQERSEKQLAVDRGAASYRTHCAVCHGTSAEGNGPLADQLKFAPADLTRLAHRNKGRFDSDMIQRIIDGRWPIKGHGGPEMPVWGDVFREPRKGYSKDVVRREIVDLAAYLATLQKP